jgi:hypothetical protein
MLETNIKNDGYMRTFLFFCGALLALPTLAYTQDTDTTHTWRTSFSGYIDAYYCFDFAQPQNNERAGFWYNHRRHNEFNVNHGIVKASVSSKNIRGNIALMIGTYSQYNLIGEQELIRNIYEGNVGVKLSKKANLWADAGIFASHIGFESAISKDCWTLLRSMLADNTPYYLSGVKTTYTSPSEKWILSAVVANGWQRIRRLPYNSMPSFGTQVQFLPTKKVTFNYSTYFGNEGTDSLKQMRFFNNFYAICTLSEKWGLIAGFDFGMQGNQQTKKTRFWNSSAVMLRYKLTSKGTFCARAEHYVDRDGVVIATGSPNGFQTLAYSLNFDYAPAENLLWRIEARGLSSKDNVLQLNNKPSKQNYVLATSMAVSF